MPWHAWGASSVSVSVTVPARSRTRPFQLTAAHDWLWLELHELSIELAKGGRTLGPPSTELGGHGWGGGCSHLNSIHSHEYSVEVVYVDVR